MSLSAPIAHRTTNRFRLGEFSLSIEQIILLLDLALYVALLAYVIPRHEPWADEAQAWELAKTLSLKSLFGTYIHYECSPGLWHGLLWILARLHVTYYGMHWFTAAIALISMAILLFKAPFPLYVRLLLPFTYFFAFQYAVVARNYVLFPTILFALASIWPIRREHPIALGFLLGLLANVALHGTVVAIGLSLILLIEWYGTRNVELQYRSRRLIAAVLFSSMLAVALWSLYPAPDAGWLVPARQMPSSISTSAASNHPWLQHLSSSFAFLIAALIRLTHVLSYGFTDKFPLGIVAWALLLWRLGRQHRLQYFLPVILLAIVCMCSLFSFYHAGLFWVTFLFVWWTTWPDPPSGFGKGNRMEAALLLTVVLCIVAQLVWAINAIRYDVSMPYSSNRDAAAILHKYRSQGYRVDVAVPPKEEDSGQAAFYITGIEPYFIAEPISNKSHRFWFWGGDDDVRAQYLADSSHQAVAVIVQEVDNDQGSQTEEDRLKGYGYQRADTVCGRIYYPDAYAPLVCAAFYLPPGRQGRNQ